MTGYTVIGMEARFAGTRALLGPITGNRLR